MATRVESTKNLVSTQAAAFIRPITLGITLNGGRPNTPMNVFFDSVKVNQYCNPTNIISNDSGSCTFQLSIPGGKFTTGVKEVIVTDAATLNQLSINGSTFGSGSANFSSTGVVEQYQKITTNVTTVEIEEIKFLPATRVVDPLAQSFFTYGVNGGVFITSIDIFFNSKDLDNDIPVSLDIRPLINGLPDKIGPSNPDWIVYKNRDDINVSDNASVATKFTFPVPIYLEEDKDYCFVLMSNSNKYNVFTSRIGENSIETGKKIFEQPYVGTMFKSENNITWIPEQFEDIKFTIYQAEFNTNSVGTIAIKATPSYWATPSSSFSTKNNSAEVTVKMRVKHGLTSTSLVNIVGRDGAMYNNISSVNFTGQRAVASVIDEYTFTYFASAQANKTGSVATGQQVTFIDVVDDGSGYTTAPSITFSGGNGTGAAATAIIVDGKVAKINVTSPGSGYTTAPSITFSGGGGTGASGVAIIEEMFAVLVNAPATAVVQNFPTYKLGNTTVSANISTHKMGYENNAVTYQQGSNLPFNITTPTYLKEYSVLATTANEAIKLSNSPSMLVTYNISTQNKNISPVIDLRSDPSFSVYSNSIRNQTGEDTESAISSSYIENIVVTSPGSGYTTAPSITFTGGGGTGAAATATLGASGVSSITVNNPGSGYQSLPTVSFTGGSGSGATAVASFAPTGVASIAVTNGGSGYTTAPTVNIIGGGFVTGQTPATATATIVSGVTNISITNGGSGYTTAPSITFSGGGGTGAAATAYASADSNFNDVVLLMKMEGTSFVDSSSRNQTIQAGVFGAPTISTSDFKFGTSSSFFGGGTGLLINNSTDFNFSGDFTVEGFFKLTYVSSNDVTTPFRVLTIVNTGTRSEFTVAVDNRNGTIFLYAGGEQNATLSNPILTVGNALQHFVWKHLAISRIGSTTYVFSNGVLLGQTATTYDISNANQVAIGNYTPPNGFSFYIGYMDELRFTKGVGRYSTTFTQPVIPFATATSGPVQLIQITNGGDGYTTAPSVVFNNTGTGGTGAAATATINGYVSGVTVNTNGNAYQEVPTITFTGGGGTGAAATATLQPRSIGAITVTSAGTYSTAPTVSISGGNPTTPATATASIAGAGIVSITVSQQGTGYTSVPDVIITRTDGSSGVDAIAVARLSEFNSETGNNGTNLSRYISKKIQVKTPSTGITIFSEIYSEQESSVDWYVRTSLSGNTTINHENLTWVPLKCDVTRNKSTNPQEILDYEFYIYNLPEFDTYDLKYVYRSSDPIKVPKVYNYRIITVV